MDKRTCLAAASGCNYPEGECLGLCMESDKKLPGVDPVADARFMLDNPSVAHSPLHCRQIVAGLLVQRDALLVALMALRDAQRGIGDLTATEVVEVQYRADFLIAAVTPKAQGSAT